MSQHTDKNHGRVYGAGKCDSSLNKTDILMIVILESEVNYGWFR